MNASKFLFALTVVIGICVLTLTIQAAPSSSPTPTSDQHHATMDTYNAMVANVVKAQQTVWLLLRDQSLSSNNLINYTAAQGQQFEYCFLQDVANPPSNNLTIEERMSIDYQVIEELTVPLRNVINYEAHNKNDSDMYQKLMWAQRQINTSLEEIQNVKSSDSLMEQLLLQSQSINDNTTRNNTQVKQGRCSGLVSNHVDEYRNLVELYIGLTFTVRDLLDIEHELDPHYPHQSQSR